MKFFTLTSLAVSVALAATANAAPKSTLVDANIDVAGNFLAYTEFELSGEPLAESLGLDLDILDANAVDQPTAFDYSAGIESYEYSEEGMYALNYRSTMGPHLANGPRNATRGGNHQALTKRLHQLAAAVGFAPDDIPANLYPLSLPYRAGSPKVTLGRVATSAGERIEALNAKGQEVVLNTLTNGYLRDVSALAWNPASFDRTLTPAAIGGILLKEVMWSQDFLGGMHDAATDEELEADSATMDHDGKIKLGVSTEDGFQGMLLTEISLDKLQILQDQLAYDGKQLGAAFGPDYDASQSPRWFPHAVAVNEQQRQGVNSLGSLKVTDRHSTLRDSWMLLWPVAEFYAFSDQRVGNTAQNPAFQAVFDGAPFASAPAANTDANVNNDIMANDAFSLAGNIGNLLLSNLETLHFDAKAGTLVDRALPGQPGKQVTTFDASYALVALSIYQRAQDALPVGYAAGDGGDVNLKTAKGKRALKLIRAQADFLLKHAIGRQGLVVDQLTIGQKAGGSQSLPSQFAAIRGLVAAGLATHDGRYTQAARAIFLAVEKHRFDKGLGTWVDEVGQPLEVTPWHAAAISGGLRAVMLNLANQDNSREPALELRHLADRYVSWFRTTINGGLQLSEPDGDTGEHRLADSNTIDADGDGVPSMIGAGYAPVLANKVRLQR